MDKHTASAGNAFKYNGETHYLVKPATREDLPKAFTIIHELQQLISTTAASAESRTYSDLNKAQVNMIFDFIVSLGKYDPTILQKNLIYLAKEYGIALGELEMFLGVSPGYVSRTAKENSGKRLGLEIAWRAALLFDIDLTELVNQDLSERRGNTILVLKFIDKLVTMTRNTSIRWHKLGGFISDCDEHLVIGKVITFDDGNAYYLKPGYPEDFKISLDGDIVSLPGFINGKSDLAIVPYKESDDGDTHYDFLTITDNINEENPNEADYSWDLFFFFYDDYEGIADKAGKKLYSAVCDMEYDAIIAPDDKAFIESFLNQ